VGRKREAARGKGGEMTQTLYAHMNKRNKKKTSPSRFIIQNFNIQKC
jgi:hypothetical protein